MPESSFSLRGGVSGNHLLETFKESLVRELSNHTIGLDSKHHYLPTSSRKKLVTNENLRALLPRSSDDHIRWLTESASITFSIALLSLHIHDELVDALECFSRHRFDDSCLPIPDLTTPQAKDICNCSGAPGVRNASDETTGHGFGSTPDVLHCIHERTMKAFSPAYWGLLGKRNFFNEQWAFIPLRFDTTVFEYNVEDQRLLPFIVGPEDKRKVGGFGDVIHVRMPKEYLLERQAMSDSLELQSDQDRQIHVAVKTLHPRAESFYDIEEEWEREVRAHRKINEMGHQNIVKGLGAFRQNQKFHLLLEWADGGSLSDFLRENTEPQLTASKLLALLVQMLGLADALNHMHTGRSVRARDQEDLPSIRIEDNQPDETNGPLRILRDDEPPMLRRRFNRLPPQRTEENFRHGDIKPENILVFKSEESWLGTLKLADFGRTKLHINDTKLRATVETEQWHTMRYEPPDLFFQHGIGKMSRLYDIWSLGCVYFELVVWLFFGTNGLIKHQNPTETAALGETQYWSKVGRKRVVASQSTSLLMNTMRQKLGSHDESALGDVLSLIQDKMLVVELPPDSDVFSPGYRCSASVVSEELAYIIERAKSDQSYLFSGAPRLEESLDIIAGETQTTDNNEPLVVVAEETHIADEMESEPVQRQPTLTARALSPKGDRRQEHYIRHLRRSKSYTGPLTSRQSGSIAGENTALTMPKLNHITLTKSRMTTQFTHSLRDTWHHEEDDMFAHKTLRAICDNGTSLERLYPNDDTEFCDTCTQFDPALPASFKTRPLASIRRTSEDCNLCEYLFYVADKGGLLATDEISLHRDGGLMKINNRPDMRFRICRSPASQKQTDTPGNDIPVGLPKLERAAKSVHKTIIQQWLKDCDDSHGNCASTWPLGYCPKRLLYLGENEVCKLVETKSLGLKQHSLKYAAFSHPWGLPKQHNHFKATRSNCPGLLATIELDQLPANYQDAIRVCRLLGIQYLWIDSICILQAADGDPGDFKDEAAFIQDIFGYAYCVIAASSAQGTSSGFLKPRKPSEPLCLPMKPREGQEGQPISRYYLSDLLDDFANDVLDGSLNERGWVMQERALARRTIFFASNQTYFECGRGVRCETLSKLRCDLSAFLGDSNFPDFGMSHKFSAQLYLIRALYEQYSALKFTHYTDKSIAISGMELRLTKSFGKRSGAGIFQQHQGRWLLWERAEDVKSLTRVQFPSSTIHNTPPSWSFMAYVGAITYIIPPSSQIQWNNQIRLKLTGDPSMMWLYAKQKLELKSRILTFDEQNAREIAELNNEPKSPAERAQNEVYITYDDPATAMEPINTFIIIGTFTLGHDIGARYYVLAVKLVSGLNDELTYERVGAGWLPDRLLNTAWEPVPYYPVI